MYVICSAITGAASFKSLAVIPSVHEALVTLSLDSSFKTTAFEEQSFPQL